LTIATTRDACTDKDIFANRIHLADVTIERPAARDLRFPELVSIGEDVTMLDLGAQWARNTAAPRSRRRKAELGADTSTEDGSLLCWIHGKSPGFREIARKWGSPPRTPLFATSRATGEITPLAIVPTIGSLTFPIA
jgi:hypothetical protein